MKTTKLRFPLLATVLLAFGLAQAQTPAAPPQPTFTVTFGTAAPANQPAAQPISITRPALPTGAAVASAAPTAAAAAASDRSSAPADAPARTELQKLTEGRFPSPPKPSTPKELTTAAPEVIAVRHGVTARIEVSDSAPNLISTPFRKPRVVDIDKIAQARPLGSDVFVLPSRETTIFIKDTAQANSPTIGLHLVPQRRPGRAINLVMDGGIPADRRETTDWGTKPSDYIDGIRSTMKSAVMGEVPSGFTEGPLSAPMAVSGAIAATPVKRYAGSDADIYRYRLVNKGTAMVTLTEEAFASDRVKAVTIYPNLAIDAGQSTEVFIMFAKEDAE
ncbi:TraK domain-containing protein [Noviherbaspirillum galbum]|uniref:TraK C-terminal domain-containing protein n=1 Tax=Noviherbaspirillum galbum TaxID=2709383 RepID=A0A6B3SRS5_9BURK|nr:type-F conjugative transfer system secretin TraK [Noviherbaspirillum galbum]NEX63394.1 hypothetical protein [Noviherbaspirillum galbum]